MEKGVVILDVKKINKILKNSDKGIHVVSLVVSVVVQKRKDLKNL